MAQPSNKRNLRRVPCSIVVSDSADSTPIGEVSDLSLDGAFITSSSPLPVGSVVALAIDLAQKGTKIQADTEVVRVTAQGMGVRFLRLKGSDARRLRRYVVEATEVAGSRDAALTLLDVDSRATLPITNPEKIAAVLRQGLKDGRFTFFPAKRPLRQQALLQTIDQKGLGFKAEDILELKTGEPVAALYVHDFVSYSFRAKVEDVGLSDFRITAPTSLQYSERRSGERTGGTSDKRVSFSVPWKAGMDSSWPVIEMTDQGLSFRAESSENFFWLGARIRELQLVSAGVSRTIDAAEIKHVSILVDEEGREYLRVGLQLNPSSPRLDSQGGPEISQAVSSSVPAAKVGWFNSVKDRVSFLFYSKFSSAISQKDATPFLTVSFTNKEGRAIVGLVNRTSNREKTLRCPLVIIPPGFGGRKETLSGLAMVLVETFRRNNRDLAVLRYDGTNNLGESYKDPGCDEEGKHNLRYKVSHAISDYEGAVAWAKSNRIVDPTAIAVVSPSISSVAVRHSLARHRDPMITMWIPFTATSL